MIFKAVIEVALKPGYSDPEGDVTCRSLRDLGYADVAEVNVGKVYRVRFRAASREEAEKMVDEFCRRLLANPVKDDYRFEVEPER
ncbi:MAG: phosphoribosylformylglycinamidine synthase subunit PurS [Candidatus Bathyarchaeia archaeon]